MLQMRDAAMAVATAATSQHNRRDPAKTSQSHLDVKAAAEDLAPDGRCGEDCRRCSRRRWPASASAADSETKNAAILRSAPPSAFRMPISFERSITISLKLLVTQSVVMARISRSAETAPRGSSARRSIRCRRRRGRCGHRLRGIRAARAARIDFETLAGRPDFDRRWRRRGFRQACGGFKVDQKFLIFRAAGGNDACQGAGLAFQRHLRTDLQVQLPCQHFAREAFALADARCCPARASTAFAATNSGDGNAPDCRSGR